MKTIRMVARSGFVSLALCLLTGIATSARAGIAPEKPGTFTGQSETEALSGVAGNYLAGRYAQRIQDWDRANDYLARTLTVDPENPELVRRAMVLAMGAGQIEKAVAMARRVPADDPDAGALAVLVLTLDDFARQDYAGALGHIKQMPEGGMSSFILPLLNGWAAAGQGRFEMPSPAPNPFQAYHSVLIAAFAGRMDRVAGFIAKPESVAGLPSAHLETLADICFRAGLKDRARLLYRDALAASGLPDDPALSAKFATLEKGGDPPPLPIRTAGQGVALALADMAGLLASEYSDDSARVFLRMALHLNPDLRSARDLLARIAARNGRYEDAIAQARFPVPAGEDESRNARFLAGLLEESGRRDEALKLLEGRVQADPDALVQIGDLHRRAEAYPEALKAYDRAFLSYEKKKIRAGWGLFYARGMVRERLGQWAQAEEDLKAALALEPDHPYILNYLGYGWADRGENLEAALGMLRKAASLRPEDGYIADSLGWALYRSGHIKEAIGPMEKAVELMPYDSLINDHLGDVYWQAGRRREARFQWRRARNFTENSALSTALGKKIESGLPDRAKNVSASPPTEDSR